jgi:hypothetical protein
MMNQYHHHSQPYSTLPSQHHFHLNSTTTTTSILQTPSTNYNLLDENYVYPSKHQPAFYPDNPYEQYPIDNSTTGESIYHPMQSNIYSNNSQLIEHPYQPQIIEQSPINRKPIVNEAKYKWMETKRAPAKRSGIVRKCIPSDK